LAGAFPGGEAAARRFRQGAAFAMGMGTPSDEQDAVSFLVDDTAAAPGPVDENGLPFDPAVQRPRILRTVRVPCAVEYFDSRGEVTQLGIVTPSRVVLTLLDEHYALVKDAVAVVIDGDRFNYRKAEPPVGLFSVTVHRLQFDAVDDK
jgi:hypothetical protein